MVHDAGQAGDILGDGNAFVLGLVRQHRTGDDVADRPDARNLGAELMIGLDLTARVQLQANLVEAEALGVGTTTDRHQDDVRFDLLGFATGGRFDRQGHARLADFGAGHLGAELIFEALLLEDLVGFLADFAVHAGQDLVEIFDHGHLGAQALPHRTQFQTDDATADDDQMARNLVQFQRAGRIDDLAACIVHGHAGQRGDRRTGGDDDVLRRHLLAIHFDGVGAGEAGQALEPGHLVLLEQIFDAAGQALDGIDALALHGGQVEAHLVDLDAQLGERAVGGFVIEFRGVQQRLRRDAADVEAGAAQRLAAFGAGGLQAQLSSADRGDIATWASTDNQDVIIEIGHGVFPSPVMPA